MLITFKTIVNWLEFPITVSEFFINYLNDKGENNLDMYDNILEQRILDKSIEHARQYHDEYEACAELFDIYGEDQTNRSIISYQPSFDYCLVIKNKTITLVNHEFACGLLGINSFASIIPAEDIINDVGFVAVFDDQ